VIGPPCEELAVRGGGEALLAEGSDAGETSLFRERGSEKGGTRRRGKKDKAVSTVCTRRILKGSFVVGRRRVGVWGVPTGLPVMLQSLGEFENKKEGLLRRGGGKSQARGWKVERHTPSGSESGQSAR